VVDDFAPLGNANTGVPQVNASAITSPNGSGHSMGLISASTWQISSTHDASGSSRGSGWSEPMSGRTRSL
jgi:hypothetical protein